MNARRPPLSRPRTRVSVLAGAGALSVVLLLLSGAGEASAQQPGWDFPPHPGWFMDAGVPVYAESVDGWRCMYFGPCRGEERTDDDPAPAWYSTTDREPLEISCEYGAYYKIYSGDRTGWVLSREIGSRYRQVACTVFDL